jgi:hypothetical protein
VCFAIFVVLMGLATLLGWRIKMPEITIPTIEMDIQHQDGGGATSTLQGFDNIDIDGGAIGGGGQAKQVNSLPWKWDVD